MKHDEKLQRIKVECQRLLALAEKRTPGKWVSEYSTNHKNGGIRAAFDHVFLFRGSYIDSEDADYIAACAGAAEAGWRATIAAIEAIQPFSATLLGEGLAAAIITAWEGLV